MLGINTAMHFLAVVAGIAMVAGLIFLHRRLAIVRDALRAVHHPRVVIRSPDRWIIEWAKALAIPVEDELSGVALPLKRITMRPWMELHFSHEILMIRLLNSTTLRRRLDVVTRREVPADLRRQLAEALEAELELHYEVVKGLPS